MAIISNDLSIMNKIHFLFLDGKILIKKSSQTKTLFNENDLPDEEIIKKCFSLQIISDWYSETGLNYSAYLLENDSPAPTNYDFISLKEFMWNCKNNSEKKNGTNSSLGGLASRAYGFLQLRQTYVHCPTCGERLIDDSVETARRCPKCSRLLFPRIEPAIIVLVKKRNEFLLVKNKRSKTGLWGCVAGFIEHGESAEQCVEREIMEETGLTVKNIKYVGSQPWPFPDQLMIAFTAEYKSGEIKIQEEELSDAKWFNKKNLPEIYGPGSVAYNLIAEIMK